MNFFNKKQKGFTLVELMVSIFIFIIIVTIVVEIFGKQVITSRNARILQRNIEDAEFAMNYVAKTLRTSSLPTSEDIVATGGLAGADQNAGTRYSDVVYAYDHSQKTCFKFAFEGSGDEGSLVVYKTEGVGQEEGESDFSAENRNVRLCAYDSTYPNKGRKLTSGNVTGGFYMTPTRKDVPEEEGEPEFYDEAMGKITISLEIDNRMSEFVEQGEIGIQNMIVIQSSVSLRDYPGDLSF